MGFRNPVTTAVDPVARDTANQALDQAMNGIIPGSRLAADAIDGRTINGVTVNGGTLQTAATGPAVRVYEGVDGKGNPMGYIDLSDGVSGDLPARITATTGIGGSGMVLDGGTYAGKAAASITLQTDGAAPELDLVANGGAVYLGSTTKLRVQSVGDVSATSTGHAFQIGADGGVVTKFDNNEMMCVDEANGNALLSWGLNSGASVPSSTITGAGSVVNKAYVDQFGYLSQSTVGADGSAGSSMTVMRNQTVTIPSGLPAGARIKVTGTVWISCPTGVGAVVDMDGLQTRSINAGGWAGDVVVTGWDTDLTPGSRTYSLQGHSTVSGQSIGFRQPYVTVEIAP